MEWQCPSSDLEDGSEDMVREMSFEEEEVRRFLRYHRYAIAAVIRQLPVAAHMPER